MTDKADVARWRRNLQGEVDGALIYRAMATNAGDDGLAALYSRMAEAEEKHAALWRDQLRAASMSAAIDPSYRARVIAWLGRRFGAGLITPMVADQERRNRTMYDRQSETAGTTLPADERSHARLLHAITGGTSGMAIARFEGRHRAVGGNALRAAVLGANDGLVSNFCLVMGVAGASSGGAPVLVAGLAGLLAGSLSMALGEWLSVQSARELYENQIATEADELAAFPDEEEEELRLIYEAKGVSSVEARRLAHRVIGGDPDVALDTMSREELGIDPQELGVGMDGRHHVVRALRDRGRRAGDPVLHHLRRLGDRRLGSPGGGRPVRTGCRDDGSDRAQPGARRSPPGRFRTRRRRDHVRHRVAGRFWNRLTLRPSRGESGQEPMAAHWRPTCMRLLRIVGCAAVAAVLVACAPSASNAPGSGVSGIAVAGPICSVVTDPPQSGCDARPVEGADLVIVDDSGDQAATVTTGADGRFTVALPPGSYRLEPQPVAGLMGTAPEVTFTVSSGVTTDLTVSYDTGIR